MVEAAGIEPAAWRFSKSLKPLWLQRKDFCPQGVTLSHGLSELRGIYQSFTPKTLPYYSRRLRVGPAG